MPDLHMTISAKTLKKFKRTIERLDDSFVVKEPLQLLHVLLQEYCDHADDWVAELFDGGRNGLGDIVDLNDPEIAKLVQEND